MGATINRIIRPRAPNGGVVKKTFANDEESINVKYTS